MTQTLFLLQPRGFCAGVSRAISTLEACLKKYSAPIFVNHEIVHNQYLIEHFEEQGVVFNVPPEEVPEKSVYLFSAHGVDPELKDRAQNRGLRVIDATCPLVTKVHHEAKRYQDQGHKIIYIGHKNHQEVIGVQGEVPTTLVENTEQAKVLDSSPFQKHPTACITQTTLSQNETREIVDILKQKIPHLKVETDICYASQNRQSAIATLKEHCDYLVVIGSQKSSNSNRLVDTAHSHNLDASLYERAGSIPDQIFEYPSVALSSGASVPESLIEEAIDRFKKSNPQITLKTIGTPEKKLHFPLPTL